MSKGNIGWMVSLWIDAFQIQLNPREDLPYLSWSPYDRVTIDEVDDFSEFFKTKESSKWNGTVQRMHLVPMGECEWKLGGRSLITVSNSGNGSYGIYCIVAARFQERFLNIMDVEQRVYAKLSECLQKKEVQWQGFHSLGAEDFVGIFLANNVADLAEIVNIIKRITYTTNDYTTRELFDSVYSFFGLNDPDFEQEPKANLLVRLYLRAGYTRKEVHNQLVTNLQTVLGDSVDIFSIKEIISGKSCLEVEIPNHIKVLSCFHNKADAVFNGQSDFYKKYIENSRTYWYILQEDILDADDENIGEIEICMEKSLNNIASETPNMHPISRFILKEYERMINSHRCLWWKPILQHQYEIYAKFVKEYTDEGNETALCTLNNKVQTVLLHINQATAPIYEVPYHNYYYAGSYNDVLKMYYGVIATIFNIAYKLPRSEETYQYEIAYCVDFEAATKVHSSMYTLKNDTRRFVIFHLPYDALMKFDKTVKLLLHEVFHYVAPFNRQNRNFIFVKILTIRVFEQYIAYLKEKGLTDGNCKNIIDYFYNHYGELCKIIDNEIDKKFYTLILNDFTITSKNSKLRNIPEKICEIICNKITSDLGLWLEEVKDCCTYKEVYSELFNVGNEKYRYFMESIRRIALAAKEAFCDLNMIFLLDLSLNEYLKLLYDAFCGKYNVNKVKVQLGDLIKKGNILIGSFEFRIGMVLNYYLNQPDNARTEQYRDAFNMEIHKIIAENQDGNQLFYEYLSQIYEQYLLKYSNELSLHKEFFSGERQWFASFQKNEYKQEKLKDAAACLKKIDDSISIIRDFKDIEIQDDSLKMNKKQANVKRFADIGLEWQKKQIEVCDLGDYVEESCRIIQEWGDDIIWFRGMCKDFYTLTPSLFRKVDPNLSLYANQARYLKGAYYATLSEVTLWTEQLRSVLEHMCFLQHYGMPTSLLDFSDDMLMALHFALNPDLPTDLREVDEHISQPKVVLFNPFIYNDAVVSLQTGKPTRHPRNISPILLDVQDNQLKDYYVHDMSKEYLSKHSQDYTKDYEPNPRTNLYPQPFAIRRSNTRIYAQNGVFVAYNLSALPSKEGKTATEYYSYLGLERIQEDYLNLLEERKKSLKDGVFIKEIYINKMAISTIKNQLKTMNITTARAYPELFRVFAEYMNKIKA